MTTRITAEGRTLPSASRSPGRRSFRVHDSSPIAGHPIRFARCEQQPAQPPSSLLGRTTRSSPALDYRNLEMRKYDRRRAGALGPDILSHGGGIAVGCRSLAVEHSRARSAAIPEQTSASPG
jgi:hypothetical protein